MNPALTPVVTSLEDISAYILSLTTDDRTLTEWHGWNHPALTRHDFARTAKSIVEKIKLAEPENVPNDILMIITLIPGKLQLLKTSTLPQLFTGNGNFAAPVFLNTMKWIESTLEPLFEWENIKNGNLVPHKITKRLRSLNDSIEALVPAKDLVEGQIRLIQEATDAAESLPTDMKALSDGKKDIEDAVAYVNSAKNKMDEILKSAATKIDTIGSFENEADKLVKQCEEAYRITTTHGLAGAFDQRAKSLSYTMLAWVFGLIVALAVGLIVGSSSVAKLSTAMTATAPNSGVIVMNGLLSLFSFGGPIWFAWIATKQIGQRFRLAEDYAFKASVAKAYEGYRKEAARIDEAFEARLFRSTLTRLEEAPLRLLDDTIHGSPWHELINSDAFTKALDVFPELKKTFVDVARGAVETTKEAIKPVPVKDV